MINERVLLGVLLAIAWFAAIAFGVALCSGCEEGCDDGDCLTIDSPEVHIPPGLVLTLDVCSACDSHDDCRFGKCLTNRWTEEQFCAKSCLVDADCPQGLRCHYQAECGLAPAQCVPSVMATACADNIGKECSS